MTALDLLLEAFDSAAHPRGYHGRWIGKPGGKVLRVFHGDASLGDVKPGESRAQTMSGVGRVVGEAGRTISTGDIARVVDEAKGSPLPTPRVIPKGGNANELKGGIPMLDAPAADRHGGFKVGDQVMHGTEPHPHEVTGLMRNGNLRVRHPVHGTTVDVFHGQARRATSAEVAGIPKVHEFKSGDRVRYARKQGAGEVKGVENGIATVEFGDGTTLRLGAGSLQPEPSASAGHSDLLRAMNLRSGNAQYRPGDKVHVVTAQGLATNGVVRKGLESYDVITSRGTERSRTMEVHWADGDVSHERPQDVTPGHHAAGGVMPSAPPPDPLDRRRIAAEADARAAASPPPRAKVGDVYQVQGRGDAGGHWKVTQAGPVQVELTSLRSGRKQVTEHRDVLNPANFKRVASPAPAFDPVTSLGREGSAARARGAAPSTAEHADTRDKLTHLPVGQRYGLHGPQGQVGHVERTDAGWHVVGPDGAGRTHKTPSSAAGAAMRLQRKAASSPQSADVMARNYRGGREVAAMNARQAKRSEAELARQHAIAAHDAAKDSAPLKPFSQAVRTGLPQGERPAADAQHRALGRVLRNIAAHTRDYSTAQNVVRWHLARANVRSVPNLSNREMSLLLKDLDELARNGPGALQSSAPAQAVLGVLLEGR